MVTFEDWIIKMRDRFPPLNVMLRLLPSMATGWLMVMGLASVIVEPAVSEKLTTPPVPAAATAARSEPAPESAVLVTCTVAAGVRFATAGAGTGTVPPPRGGSCNLGASVRVG